MRCFLRSWYWDRLCGLHGLLETTDLSDAPHNAEALESANETAKAESAQGTVSEAALAAFRAVFQEPMSTADKLSSETYSAGLRARAELLATAVPLAEVAEQVGVNPSQLRQRIAEGSLLGLENPAKRGWLIPAFQLAPESADGFLPHLSSLLRARGRDASAVAVARALTAPQEETDNQAPRDWLIAGGDPAPVCALMASL